MMPKFLKSLWSKMKDQDAKRAARLRERNAEIRALPVHLRLLARWRALSFILAMLLGFLMSEAYFFLIAWFLVVSLSNLVFNKADGWSMKTLRFGSNVSLVLLFLPLLFGLSNQSTLSSDIRQGLDLYEIHAGQKMKIEDRVDAFISDFRDSKLHSGTIEVSQVFSERFTFLDGPMSRWMSGKQIKLAQMFTPEQLGPDPQGLAALYQAKKITMIADSADPDKILEGDIDGDWVVMCMSDAQGDVIHMSIPQPFMSRDLTDDPMFAPVKFACMLAVAVTERTAT